MLALHILHFLDLDQASKKYSIRIVNVSFPVTDNGLGLAYNIHDGELIINVTSFIGEADKYAASLEEALLDMQRILDAQ
jgi:hypothetical protein